MYCVMTVSTSMLIMQVIVAVPTPYQKSQDAMLADKVFTLPPKLILYSAPDISICLQAPRQQPVGGG